MTRKKCRSCGKTLLSEASIDLGIGPTCLRRESVKYGKHGKPSDNQTTIYNFIQKIKFLDTFAGAGGFHLALERSLGKENIDCIGFSEIDKFAKQTYLKNFPGSRDFGDITKIDIKDIPDLDLVTGGFPCQDVSLAGNQDLKGGRTVLAENVIQIIEIKKPDNFVLENVKGLLNKKFKDFFDSIIARLNNAGYEVNIKVLNSKYFGLPQNRERVFLVGSKKGKNNFNFPEGSELTNFLKDILEHEVDNKYYLTEKQLEGLKKYDSNNRKYSVFGISPTLNTAQGGHRQVKVSYSPRTRVSSSGAHCISRELLWKRCFR